MKPMMCLCWLPPLVISGIKDVERKSAQTISHVFAWEHLEGVPSCLLVIRFVVGAGVALYVGVAGPVGHSRRFTVYIYIIYIYIVLYINVLQQALQCCNRVVSRMHQSANAQGKSMPQQNIAFC